MKEVEKILNQKSAREFSKGRHDKIYLGNIIRHGLIVGQVIKITPKGYKIVYAQRRFKYNFGEQPKTYFRIKIKQILDYNGFIICNNFNEIDKAINAFTPRKKEEVDYLKEKLHFTQLFQIL